MNQGKEFKKMAKRLGYQHMTAVQVSTIKALRDGQDAFVIAAPGQGKSGIFHGAALLDESRLVVVDEAHLVLQWGRTFRSDYLEIGKFIDNLNHRPVVLALTATAPLEDRVEIKDITVGPPRSFRFGWQTHL